jgi:hypothetical protein
VVFNFAIGRVRRTPVWMCEAGLEWLYRVAQGPCRLWRRHFVEDTTFMARVLAEVVSVRPMRPVRRAGGNPGRRSRPDRPANPALSAAVACLTIDQPQ